MTRYTGDSPHDTLRELLTYKLDIKTTECTDIKDNKKRTDFFNSAVA